MTEALQKPSKHISLEHALARIQCIDSAASLKKLHDLREQLVLNLLVTGADEDIVLTDNIQINLVQINELFSGADGSVLTARGVYLLNRLYNELYLDFSVSPQGFPGSLIEYAQSLAVQESSAQTHISPAARSRFLSKLKKEDLNYSTLFYVFDNVVGSRAGNQTLQLAGISVTRSTIRSATAGDCHRYETVFHWPTDSQKTQFCLRDN